MPRNNLESPVIGLFPPLTTPVNHEHNKDLDIFVYYWTFLINNSPMEIFKVKCCVIIRSLKDNRPYYEAFIEEEDNSRTFFLAATLKSGKKRTYYISTKRGNSFEKGIVAKVRSNFIGTEYIVYDTHEKYNHKIHTDINLRREFAAILYEPNPMGLKGPRRMKLLLPLMNEGSHIAQIKPSSKEETLIERHRTGKSDVAVLSNKKPMWNEETQSFVLNFRGRVTRSSVKNFQLVHDKDLDYIVLQFGRIGDDTFTMDYQYPLCAVQAFGIALTSFDAKFASE